MGAERDIRAVAFDLDGLMFNTEELYIEVSERLLERRGRVLEPEIVHRIQGRPAKIVYPMIIEWYQLPDTPEQMEAETSQLFQELLLTRLAPRPGLLELLEHLDRHRYPKAIATNSGRRYLERVLEIAGLPTQFDFLLSVDDVRNGKPDPEIYRKAAERFGVAPRQMLVLEDSEFGCRAAEQAEAHVVAIPGPHTLNPDYPSAHWIAESLHDPRILELLRPTESDV
jgi:pseudouridine-5'-monophosphatase